MTEETVRQIIREELASLLKSDRYVFEKNIQILDGRKIQVGRTNGTIIASASDQKLGFFGKTPVAQQTTVTTPSGGGTQDAQARSSIGEIKTILTNLGLTS